MLKKRSDHNSIYWCALGVAIYTYGNDQTVLLSKSSSLSESKVDRYPSVGASKQGITSSYRRKKKEIIKECIWLINFVKINKPANYTNQYYMWKA